MSGKEQSLEHFSSKEAFDDIGLKESVVRKYRAWEHKLYQTGYDGNGITWLQENTPSVNSFSIETGISESPTRKIFLFYKIPMLSLPEAIEKLWGNENHRQRMKKAQSRGALESHARRREDNALNGLINIHSNGDVRCQAEINVHHTILKEITTYTKPREKVISIPHDGKGEQLVRALWISREIIEQIKVNKDNADPLLITDPIGLGKDFIAKTLHYSSDKKNSPYVPINCAEVPRDLWEGAFNGYVKGEVGIYQNVGSGTVYLNELSEIPPNIQTKLLRFLKDRIIRPVGSNDTNNLPRFEGRVILGTNRDLSDPSLREYIFRLCTISEFIKVPSLS